MKMSPKNEKEARVEEIIRLSERSRIAEYVRGLREDDTDQPRVQVFDVLASQILSGLHWKKEL